MIHVINADDAVLGKRVASLDNRARIVFGRRRDLYSYAVLHKRLCRLLGGPDHGRLSRLVRSDGGPVVGLRWRDRGPGPSAIPGFRGGPGYRFRRGGEKY